MKTRLYLFLCILIAVASCKDEVPFEPELTVLSSSVQMYESDGGEKFWSIRSNVEWTAITTADWISVSPLSGDGSVASTKISIRENDSYDFREGKIIFRNNEYNLTDTVTIKQAQKDAIILAQDSCKVSCDGCELKFTVSSNVNYDVQTPSWIKHLKSRGLTDKDIFFDVEANGKMESRTGTITFKSGDLVQEVAVVQDGYDDSAEREILIAFYQATDGDNWKNNENWCSDKPLGEWYGVTLDKNNRVSRLRLYSNELSGSIPPELGNLTSLEYLDLSRNELSGSIPPELGNLSSLKYLNLAINKELSGSIPSELGNLTNLTELDLDWNLLSGSIPSELGDLSNLQYLNLSRNELSGSIPSELGNLSNLRALSSYANNLSGSIPSELGNLSNLKYLILSGNQLSGSIPSELGNLTNLTDLTLSVNQLSGSIPSELGNLANLTDLKLKANQLSGSIPSELGNLTNLEFVDLFNNQLSGLVPFRLENLTNLRRLDLRYNQFEGDVPFYYPALSFTVTDISGNTIKSDELYEKNEITILYLWGKWCGYSLAYNRTLIGLLQQYGSKGLEVIGGYTRYNDDETDLEIINYISKNIPWNNFIRSDDNRIEGFNEGGVPHVFVIDKNKNMIFTSREFNRDELPAFLYEYFQE